MFNLNKANQRSLAWVLVMLFAVLTVVGIVIWEGLTDQPASKDPSSTRDAIEATVARIEFENAHPKNTVSIVSNHDVASKPPIAAKRISTPPLLKDGYSLSKFHGEMKKAVLDTTKRDYDAFKSEEFQWLHDAHAIELLVAQAKDASRDWTFGVLLLDNEANLESLKKSISNFDVELIGTSGRVVRAKLPGDEALLEAIQALPEVAAISPLPTSAKLSEAAHALFRQTPDESMPVFVTLMDVDQDEHWRRSLESLDATVGQFDASIRVYSVAANYDTILDIASLDFVVAVEPVGVVKAVHDTVIPSMGADTLRMYDNDSGLFSGIGGASVPIAVMDTGLNLRHMDIATNRESICGANFVYFDPPYDEADLWIDEDGHGTHVTGTIVGNGTVKPQYSGFAPLVRHIRFAKVLSHNGNGTEHFIFRGMEYLQNEIGCYVDGSETKSVKPLIVNMSLSSNSLRFDGRHASSRKLDAVVWQDKQLYVVAHSNSDIHGYSNYAAAKNSLGVGATLDNGALAGFSSLGPTYDGRLSPLIVATGVEVNSTKGNSSLNGYVSFSGTSMSSPAVAGVASLVLDTQPEYQSYPALTRARLLASAIKADAWLENEDSFRRNNSKGPGSLQARYGLGLVSARTSAVQLDKPNGWQNGSSSVELENGKYGYVDIEVEENTARLDLVLTWDEPPGDTFSNTVLNDLDLWVDRDGDCNLEPCGEYASQSHIDNVEWLVISNPEPGTYRAKIVASRVYTETPRAALAWTAIRDSSTPTLSLNVEREVIEVDAHGNEIEFSVSLTSDAFVAAGTRLQIDCRTPVGQFCFSYTEITVASVREDGIKQEGRVRLGEVIELGELAVGETWTAQLRFNDMVLAGTEAYRLFLKANTWNGNSDSESILVRLIDKPDANVEYVSVPANDDFADAQLIEGADGAIEFDLLNATAESGEMQLESDGRHAMGSVWYRWNALANERTSFTTMNGQERSNYAHDLIVFQGNNLSALRPIALGSGNVSFFSRAGESYRIRVSRGSVSRFEDGRSMRSSLIWSSGLSPINDKFLAALPISEEGNVSGTNAGATTEAGESFGELAATVWYRWESPMEGDWTFQVNRDGLVGMAFTGDRLGNLRLVSHLPAKDFTFPALDGEIYWLAVASSDSRTAGRPFDLSWKHVVHEPSNDEFQHAVAMSVDEPSTNVDVDINATVEPHEPLWSGIRTQWWVWTAPASQDYTWYIDELTQPTDGPNNKMMVSVFSGSGLEDLELVASNGPRMSDRFKFSAVEGQEYFFASGLPTDFSLAFNRYRTGNLSATLVHGATPVNDDLTQAVSLFGQQGSVTATTEFASNSQHERIDLIGRASLWWTVEVQDSGVFKFLIDDEENDWVLTIHRDVEDWVSESTMIASGRGNSLRAYLEKGVVYTIGVGAPGANRGGEFTLRWEPVIQSDLRYVGQFADGDTDIQGVRVSLPHPDVIEIHPNGGSVYVVSEGNLHVFDRDAATGELIHVQQIQEQSLSEHLDLVLWDRLNNRLLISDCYRGTWRAFKYAAGSLYLSQVSDPPGHSGACPATLWLLDRTGSNLYVFLSSTIRHYAIDTAGNVLRDSAYETNSNIYGAVLTHDGEHLYVSLDDGLRVYTVDLNSGRLAQIDFEDITLSFSSRNEDVPAPMVITEDDSFLIVLDDSDRPVKLLSIRDRLRPKQIAENELFPDAPDSVLCQYADMRIEQTLVDVFCEDSVVTLRIELEGESIEYAGSLASGEPDEVGSLVPSLYGLEGFVVSPDDRFLYGTYRRQDANEPSGLVIFDRNATLTAENGSNVAISMAETEERIYEIGEEFSLQAIVGNRGQARTGMSTLRFYQSKDPNITPEDTLVGNGSLIDVDADEQYIHSIHLRAPLDPDTYYYGACIEESTVEIDVSINCSEGVVIEVSAP